MERLLHKGIILVFVLALLAIVGGIALNWQQSSTGSKQSKVSSEAVQQIVRQSAETQKSAPSPSKEVTARDKQGTNLSITASGQGQVSVGGDVINAKGNVEKKNAE